MISRILTSALFAGASAGVIAGALQWQFVQPVLLHAELYEQGVLMHFNGSLSSAAVELERLQPLRDILTLIFTMLIYTGYALLLVALMSVRHQNGDAPSPRQGIVWGLAGFIAIQLAPALSLPPEVPGVAAADVEARQVWWYATIAATAIGLWLISFSTRAAFMAGGAILIVIPHLVGAPEPDVFTGPAPTEIGALFASRALGIGLASWAALGYFAALFYAQESKRSNNED